MSSSAIALPAIVVSQGRIIAGLRCGTRIGDGASLPVDRRTGRDEQGSGPFGTHGPGSAPFG